MKDEFEGIWKEVVVVNFKVLTSKEIKAHEQDQVPERFYSGTQTNCENFPMYLCLKLESVAQSV
jgi:hypothetical protein